MSIFEKFLKRNKGEGNKNDSEMLAKIKEKAERADAENAKKYENKPYSAEINALKVFARTMLEKDYEYDDFDAFLDNLETYTIGELYRAGKGKEEEVLSRIEDQIDSGEIYRKV